MEFESGNQYFEKFLILECYRLVENYFDRVKIRMKLLGIVLKNETGN